MIVRLWIDIIRCWMMFGVTASILSFCCSFFISFSKIKNVSALYSYSSKSSDEGTFKEVLNFLKDTAFGWLQVKNFFLLFGFFFSFTFVDSGNWSSDMVQHWRAQTLKSGCLVSHLGFSKYNFSNFSRFLTFLSLLYLQNGYIYNFYVYSCWWIKWDNPCKAI